LDLSFSWPDLSFFIAVSIESSPMVGIRGLVAGYKLNGGSVTNKYNGVKRDFATSFFLYFKTATLVLMKGWINPSPSSHYSTRAVLLKYNTEVGSLSQSCTIILTPSYLIARKTLDANQDIRRKKVQELLAKTHQSSVTGEAVDIGRVTFKTTLNLLSNTIFSVDLADLNSNTVREFKEIVWNVMKEAGKPNLAYYFPVLKKIDPQGVRWCMTVHFGKLIDLFDRMISQR
jgi:hypothetical protein